MKKIATICMMVMMIVSGMGTIKANAVEPKNPTAQEFKEVLTEMFRWDEYSPCQIEMTQWIFNAGFDDGVIERISRVPVTVRCGCSTIEYSVVLYFVNEEEGTAKRIDYYVLKNGRWIGCNWNNAWGENKRVEPYDRFDNMIRFD